jgi:hypothetical protein
VKPEDSPLPVDDSVVVEPFALWIVEVDPP